MPWYTSSMTNLSSAVQNVLRYETSRIETGVLKPARCLNVTWMTTALLEELKDGGLVRWDYGRTWRLTDAGMSAYNSL